MEFLNQILREALDKLHDERENDTIKGTIRRLEKLNEINSFTQDDILFGILVSLMETNEALGAIAGCLMRTDEASSVFNNDIEKTLSRLKDDEESDEPYSEYELMEDMDDSFANFIKWVES